MDASASPKPDADINKVYGFFLKIEGNEYSAPPRQKSTVIKYTKLPDFDFDTKARDMRASPVKMSNRSIETDFKSEKHSSNRTTSRLTSFSKYTKETKSSAKTNSAYNKKEVNLTQQNYRGRNTSSVSVEHTKTKQIKDKESTRYSKSLNASKTNVSKHIVTPSESEKELTRLKNILYDNLKTNVCKKEKPRLSKEPPPQNKNKLNFKEMSVKHKPLTVIRVPLDEKYQKPKLRVLKSDATIKSNVESVEMLNTTDFGVNTDEIIQQITHVNIGTDPPISVDQVTEIDDTIYKCENTVQTECVREIFDSLEIPNVTLTKEKCEPRGGCKETVKLRSESLPNLQVPPFKICSSKEDVSSSDISFCQSASYIFSHATLTYTTKQKINFHVVDNNEEVSPNIPPSSLNYPINVVSVFNNELKNKNRHDNVSSDNTYKKKKNHSRDDYINCLNELNSLNCSYVFNKLMKPSDIISTIRVNNGLLQNDYICEQFQRELNFIDSFFESLQYLESCSLSDKCFTDKKVESLVNNSVLFDSTFDVKNSEYDNFLSKLENGANIDDTETMASKSLCLLNLLIRDEQRRAKNLLFVLKMREDALKDFTKSQILWLEKKKKHENTDISTLKKKQRGALLKLQHECGEMQRMRKALLTLSEKRKVALMKTKKNIELKLKNNVEVEQIILGKKKLKRSLSADRNSSPLKCFDLSSSGCEDSTTSRLNSDAPLPPEALAVTPVVAPAVAPAVVSVSSAEKCVQAGDALCSIFKQHDSNITAENFVAVDGGYLNILFHDLTLPQIFSSGKQYEVNEEALKNIINSTNNSHNNLSGTEVVDKLMDQIKNRELETSSPSTARSLVEEFDQYYRGLAEDDKFVPDSSEGERDSSDTIKVCEVKDSSVQFDYKTELPSKPSHQSISTMTCGEEDLFGSDMNLSENNIQLCDCESVITMESQCAQGKEPVVCASNQTQTGLQAGPLPVPVGAAAVDDVQPSDAPAWDPPKSSASTDSDTDSVSSQPQSASGSAVTTLSTPVQCEAEELRRQQLAIEREIKALEQQHCRLLVVREIPDKPPPPYTPPTETKPRPPRMFALEDDTEQRIENFFTDPVALKSEENKDAFDAFLKDYCQESLDRHKQEQSDKPWDTCNLLPQKPQVDTQKLVQNTCIEIKEVLTNVTPTTVSGVSSRRSDHIDDILFAEWRRCEPEWTTLHTDEAIVKYQLFESIFQKMLSETVDEYKKTVTPEVITTD
ncbi:uncharacterized protein LOC142986268 isoform X2 [Anticarsia gemmatalis]|uniref:uncharacterized protein LOC142986268 isoform X2 n=1 Tax=Anticarsia gemmatalis TaxID=129554 RepID=UPI003F763379